LEIFGDACCTTTFEAAALAQYWGETANFLAAALKSPKVENNKRFLFAVCFQNKDHYPTVKHFYT